MKEQNKRKNNLSIELMELRQRIIELETLANERKRTEEALRKNEEELRKLGRENAAMAEIGRIISSSLNINEVYEQFGEEVLKVITFDRIAISIINHEKGTFYNAYIVGHDVPERGLGKVTPLAGSLTEEVMRRRSSAHTDRGQRRGGRPIPGPLTSFSGRNSIIHGGSLDLQRSSYWSPAHFLGQDQSLCGGRQEPCREYW